jgi:hypothetical protein
MKLKWEHFNPDFWYEKACEYLTENDLKPSLKNKLKLVGASLAAVGTAMPVIPCIYGIDRFDKKGGLDGRLERIHNSLLEKGYYQQELSKYSICLS